MKTIEIVWLVISGAGEEYSRFVAAGRSRGLTYCIEEKVGPGCFRDLHSNLPWP
jgi:hypothetical protein